MALQQPFSDDATTFDAAYHRVVRLYVDLDTPLVELVVSIWATEADRLAGRPPVGGERWVLDATQITPFKTGVLNGVAEAYNYLKGQTTYQAALDV